MRTSETYPFESHFLELEDGNKIHYLDEGPKTKHAWVMVHGNPTWSYYYRNLVKVLKGNSRCIVPDHLGCGWSDKPQDHAYQLKDRIDHLVQLIDHLEVDSISLVVHDWGGAIGMGLAERKPETIKKIILLNTAAYTDQNIPFRISICKWPVIGTVVNRGLNGFARPALTMAVGKGKKLDEEVAAMMISPYDNWNNRVAVNAFVKDIPLEKEHPTYPVLESIEKSLHQFADLPIYIFWGAQDFCFNLHFYQRWKEFWPKAKCTLFKDAGHYVLEDEKEAIQKAVLKIREDHPDA